MVYIVIHAECFVTSMFYDKHLRRWQINEQFQCADGQTRFLTWFV